MKWSAFFFLLGVVSCGPSVDRRFESVWNEPAPSGDVRHSGGTASPSHTNTVASHHAVDSAGGNHSTASGDQATTRSDAGTTGAAHADEPSRPDVLVINEILYDVVGSDTDGHVFIELSGTDGGNIAGYKINLVKGSDGTIDKTITLPAGAVMGDDGLFVIADAKTGVADQTFVTRADFIDNFDPQNGPDCVQLVDDNGALVDALGYGTPLVAHAENGLPCFEGTPAVDVASGSSLSRVNGKDTNDNGMDFIALGHPTPGTL